MWPYYEYWHSCDLPSLSLSLSLFIVVIVLSLSLFSSPPLPFFTIQSYQVDYARMNSLRSSFFFLSFFLFFFFVPSDPSLRSDGANTWWLHATVKSTIEYQEEQSCWINQHTTSISLNLTSLSLFFLSILLESLYFLVSLLTWNNCTTVHVYTVIKLTEVSWLALPLSSPLLSSPLPSSLCLPVTWLHWSTF